MEAVIAKLLSTNNEERKQATRHVCEIMKNPIAFQEFWTVVVNSSNPDARQAAAMYFYKMVQKKKKWNQLPDEVRQRIKESVLERIHQEPEKKVKTVIVQAAGQIALHEVDGWPELFRLIEETISFEGMTEMRELGMFVISILTEHATSLFELHVTALMNVFGSVLTKPEYYGSPLAYLTVISMKNFLLFFHQKDKTIAQNFEYLIPSVLEVVKAQSSRNRPDRSIECLCFFEALLDSYPRIVTANLKFIIEGLLRIAVFLNVNEISCKVLDVISTIICQKTKKIAKDKDILQMLCQTLYEIISSPKSVEEGGDHYDVYEGDTNIVNGAVDLLDTLADEIDAEILMKHMMPILDGAANSDNPFCKKAMFIILGVLVEKCRNQIKAAGLNSLIHFMSESLKSDCYLTLNGALFTLWRFVEYFKPDINVFLPDLIPLVLRLLQNIETNVNRIEVHLIPKIFCILNESCEICESAIEPVLPVMVPTLLTVINSKVKIHYRELAISVIGSAGAATKRAFREYFSMVLEVLRPFLAGDLPDEQLPLQVQTFDTLGTLFKSLYVKGDEFQLVEDVVNVTLTITELKNCGELRSGLYSMMSDCSEFMKEKMECYIPRILKLMDISFKEIDSYIAQHNAEVLASHGMNLDFDGDKQTAPVKDLKIIEEKEEALMALGNIAFNVGHPFQPYLKQCYVLCDSLSSHENNVIRAAAMEALANLYISIKRCFPNENSPEIPSSCSSLVKKFGHVVQADENVDVVYAVLEGYQKILKHIPQIANVIVEENPNGASPTTNGVIIGGAVKVIITEKSCCQKLKMQEDDSDDEDDEDDDDDNDDDDEEIDDNYSVEDLIIAAEELIPLLGDCLSTETFLIYFSSYQRHLLKLLEKHQVNEIRESTSATLGLCAKYLGSYMNVFAIEFAPIFPTLMKDINDNVRNNVAFCLAQMVIHGKEAVYSYFADIASSLMSWLPMEKCRMVIDNICAAFASLIVINKDLLPLSEILPTFFMFVPLEQDFDENTIVFRSFNVIFQDEKYKDYLPKAVEAVLISSCKKQIVSDEAKQEAFRFIELVSKCYANDKEFILRNIRDELKSHFLASV